MQTELERARILVEKDNKNKARRDELSAEIPHMTDEELAEHLGDYSEGYGSFVREVNLEIHMRALVLRQEEGKQPGGLPIEAKRGFNAKMEEVYPGDYLAIQTLPGRNGKHYVQVVATQSIGLGKDGITTLIVRVTNTEETLDSYEYDHDHSVDIWRVL